MADNGVEFELAEQCLAHSVGNGVVQAYQRSSMIERRRPVMQRWADFLTSKGAAKVGCAAMTGKTTTKPQPTAPIVSGAMFDPNAPSQPLSAEAHRRAASHDPCSAVADHDDRAQARTSDDRAGRTHHG